MLKRALFCLLLLIVSRSDVRCENGKSIQEIKKEYLSLRNTDPDIRKREAWEDMGDRLTSWADTHEGRDESASTLYDAAMIYEQLYLHAKKSSYLEKAISLLTRVSEEYPKNVFAADALLKAGDLFLRDDEEDDAHARYEELIHRYPKSKKASVAKKRITHGLPPENEFVSNAPAKGMKVVLDPGHGGEDFGAIGINEMMEKDVTLDIALKVESILQLMGYHVLLTRRSDEFVPLERRTSYANVNNADIFVSLHTNSSPSGKLSGLETYYLDNTGDQASQSLADRENSAGKSAGDTPDLSFILSDLIQSAKLPASIKLAKTLQNEITGELSKGWDSVKSLDVKRAPFYVLVGAHMPSVLVEMYFINNETDGKRLGNELFRRDLAKGISAGIRQYLGRLKNEKSNQ